MNLNNTNGKNILLAFSKISLRASKFMKFYYNLKDRKTYCLTIHWFEPAEIVEISEKELYDYLEDLLLKNEIEISSFRLATYVPSVYEKLIKNDVYKPSLDFDDAFTRIKEELYCNVYDFLALKRNKKIKDENLKDRLIENLEGLKIIIDSCLSKIQEKANG